MIASHGLHPLFFHCFECDLPKWAWCLKGALHDRDIKACHANICLPFNPLHPSKPRCPSQRTRARSYLKLSISASLFISKWITDNVLSVHTGHWSSTVAKYTRQQYIRAAGIFIRSREGMASGCTTIALKRYPLIPVPSLAYLMSALCADAPCTS